MAFRHQESELAGAESRNVLIVSDDPGFTRELSDRWQQERNIPALTVVGSTLAHNVDREAYEVAIVGGLRLEALLSVLRVLDSNGKPVILLCELGSTADQYRHEFARLLVLRQREEWGETLVLLASEVLRRSEAVNRAQRAEQINALLRCHATLGQYVIDMRHTMNNALTSVLGNAELLLLEPGAFSAGVRSQIDTIRNMALRLHEILQRFSSLEKEMTFVEKQAAKEQSSKSSNTQAAAVGQ
jgi:signal transduction histidine kinase